MIARQFPSLSQTQAFPSFSQASNSFVIFDYGAGFTSLTVEVIPSEKVNRPTPPQKTGYIFSGWFADTLFTKEWDFNAILGGDNITLYAMWIPISYTVAYNKNAADATGTTQNSIHTYDAGSVTPNGFTRTGYTFIGWNTKSDGSGNNYADAASVKNLTASNGTTVTLYAIWQINKYTVAFDVNGGSPNPVDQIITFGEKAIQPAVVVSKTGYTLAGWYKDTLFNHLWNFTIDVVGGDITLYAKWVVNHYSVTYYLGGGENNPANPKSYTVEDHDIVLAKPIRDDSEFVAWYGDAMFEGFPVEAIHTKSAADISLYARFLAKQKVIAEVKAVSQDRYEGDPKLYLTENGADMRYEAGQPVMEKGLENQTLISLFTQEGWCGNVFLPPENKVGSGYEKACQGSITLKKLVDIEDAAVRAMTSKAFPQVDAKAHNPKSDHLQVEITVKGGGVLSLSREGALWTNQRNKA